MTQAVAHLCDEFQKLSVQERTEFVINITVPRVDAEYGELTDDDLTLIAAESFARLDAEEEEYARTHPETR